MNKKKSDVIIVGAGIIGLCSAYYLNSRGYRVRILEANDKLEGCSHGNAGHICESHIIPLANPAVFKKSLLWLLNSKSPFYIRPRLDGGLISWGRKFISFSFERSQKDKIEFLARFGRDSIRSYNRIFEELGFESINRNGIATLCNSDEGLDSEKEMAVINQEFGITPTHLSPEDFGELEPNLKLNAKGGVLYKSDFSVDPSNLVHTLSRHLSEKGVRIDFGARVEKLEFEKLKVTAARTKDGLLKADQFLLCTGAWAPRLWNKEGARLLMQPAKGYSIDIPSKGQIRSSSLIFSEKKVVLTPMGDRIRIAGTLELSGFDNKIRQNRVKGILAGVREFAPEIYDRSLEKAKVWYGYRPASPDGIPYIGRHGKIQNLFVNSGHSMLGLALGAASGKMISDLISGSKPELVSGVVDPERFSR